MNIVDRVKNIGMLAALAQVPDVPKVPFITDITTAQGLYAKIVGWLLVIAGIVAVLYLIYGGFLYLTAGGDAERATKAKTTIVNAIIGIIIIALAFAIYSAVRSLIK